MRAPALTDLIAPPPIAPRATGGTGAPGFPDALRMAQIRVTPADMPATVPATSTPAQTTQAPTIPAAPIPASPQITVRRMTPEQPSHPTPAEGKLSTEIAQPSGSEILTTESIPATDASPAITPQAVAPDAPLAPETAPAESTTEETHPVDIQTPETPPTDAMPLAAPLTPAQPETPRAAPAAPPATTTLQQAPGITPPEATADPLPAEAPAPIRTGEAALPAAATPAPATPQPIADTGPSRLDMTQAQWAETLVEDITRHAAGPATERLTLTLTPERLGTLQIRLEMQDGLTHVHIVTETPEAARAVAEGQHRLADALSRAGLELGSQSTQSGGTGRDPGQSGQPAPDTRAGPEPQPDDRVATDPVPQRTTTRATTSVDLLA
ncbi:MAG: flagellar hook-length control protein FliK [Roseovarius sp.]|uniref:flagellar hook-length control protein FliK n=1 Tax=Roseovarius sp. TaxID=1486281 RepID=UPI0032EED90E